MKILPENIKGFTILAAVCWGFSLYLYEVRKESINRSLMRA